MSIFGTTRDPFSDDLDALLRKSLKRAMLARSINEETLAAELTKRLGRPVTAALVNAWKAETKHRWHLPANLVPFICEILEDDSIQRLLLSEKLKESLDLGESARRVVSLLRAALGEERKRESPKKPQRRPKS
jgi:hypothetical protein